MKNNRIKKMTGVAILTSVLVVLALISNYVTIGTVNINLALIPIVIGACVYGPLAGLFLGAVDGVMILLAPSTMLFLSYNVFVTVLLCILKTGIGGLLSGYVYQLLKRKNEYLGVILSSIVLPITNTVIFLIGVFCFFMPVYLNLAPEGSNIVSFIITSTLTINFLIELIVNIALSSTIYRIIRIGAVKKLD